VLRLVVVERDGEPETVAVVVGGSLDVRDKQHGGVAE
jgi:hypothetical protein